MFKWFWTTFSLGAPESGLLEIRHCVLTVNFLNMIIYFFSFEWIKLFLETVS